MKDKNMFKFHLFYLMLIGGMGAFYPYINVYLEKSIHLTGSQIGLLNSVSLLVAVSIMPIWGILGDKTKRYKSLLLLTMLLTLVSLYFYSKQTVYIGIFIWAIIFKTIALPSNSLADTITMNYTKKHGGNYGSIRGMGSLGYVLFSTSVGFLADRFGLDGPLFICYMSALVVAIILAFGFPNEKAEEEKINVKEKISIVDLLKNKKYVFILLLVMLSQVAIDGAGNFAGNHLTVTLNGSNSLISFYSLIQVLPEFLFLMVASQVVQKTGYKKYMLVAFITMAIRMFVYSFVSNPIAFIAVSIVHCLGVAFSSVATLAYIQDVVEERVFGTAVSFLSVAINLGGAIYGYIYGVIYQYMSSYTIFMVSGCVVLVAIVLTVLFFEDSPIQKEQ